MDKYLKSLNKKGLLLIFFGTIIWSILLVKSGLIYDYGMGFWGPNGHDGVWHIAVAGGLARGDWGMPVFAGQTLTNYHIGYDLLVSWIHKLTFIPITNIYFQILPPIMALLVGLSVWQFIYRWKRSKTQAFWATFFVYFGGGLGWIVTLLRSGELGGESLFWSQQSISTLINPPFALSILFIFLGLMLLQKGIKYENKKALIIVTFLFGILIQIKVYAGILMLGGLLIAAIIRLLQGKGITLFKVFAGSLIISILLFSPLNKDADQSIIFKPFWFLETMMQFSDRFNWAKFGEAMVNYKLGGVWVKAIIAYSIALAIFIIGNFGIRIISLKLVLGNIRKLNNLSYLEVLLFSMILTGVVLPLLFVQRGTAWNTLQFMYYSLIFSGVLSGLVVGQLIEKYKKNIKLVYFIIILVLVINIPTVYGTLGHYLPSRPPAKISNQELEALDFLSQQPKGVVLTQLFDQKAADAAESNPPRPLHLYESTAYVSAYSNKTTFLEDEVNLDITGYDWQTRRGEVERLLEDVNKDFLRVFLKENNIAYIYWIKDNHERLNENELGLDNIFENNEVVVWKISLQ